MAPPKSYMIPLQFPAGLYDYAKPPGPFAHWTSAPLYSYEEFARSNPRPKRGERKGRAHRNGPTLDRPNYPFQEMEEKYAKYTDAELHYALQDAREAARHEDEMAKKGHGLAKHGWYADDVHTISKEIMHRRSGKARRNGAPEYYDVPQNAGPFWPGAYPYGAFGRPAAYGPTAREAAEARAKPNPHGAYLGAFREVKYMPGSSKLQEVWTHVYEGDANAEAFLRQRREDEDKAKAERDAIYREALERHRSRKNPRGAGKDYSDVLRKHGRAGFGIPEKAPHAGSFPLYPVKRARYAIAIVAAPAYDGHPEERERILRAAVEAHPELKSMAQHALAKVVSRIGVRAAANGKRRK
jgi:hypothetical protein